MTDYPDAIIGRLEPAVDGITYMLVTRNGEPISPNEWLALKEEFHHCMVEISIKLYTK